MEQDNSLDEIKDISETIIKMTSALGIVVLAYDWFFKLLNAFRLEIEYGIEAKYFFSYNFLSLSNKVIPLAMSIFLYYVSNHVIKMLDLKDWVKYIRNAIICYFYFGIGLNLSCLWILGLISIVIIGTYIAVEYEKLKILDIIVYGGLIIISIVVIIYELKMAPQIYQVTKLQEATEKNKSQIIDYIVLSEYERKYLVVPYKIKNVKCEKGNIKICKKYDISSPNKPNSDKPGSYKFIDKFGNTFKSVKLDKNYVEVE